MKHFNYINKVIIRLILIILLFFSQNIIAKDLINSKTRWINLGLSYKEGKKAELKIKQDIDTSKSRDQKVQKLSPIEGELIINGVWLKEYKVDQNDYQLFVIPDCTFTKNVGQAQLPVILKNFEIPSGVQVNITTTISEAVDLGKDFVIMPAQEPEVDLVTTNPQFQIDKDYYNGRKKIKTSICEIDGPHIIRGKRFIQVKFFPLIYDPVTGEVKMIPKIKFNINFTGRQESNTGGNKLYRLNNQFYDTLFSGMLSNYSEAEKNTNNVDNIIINSALSEEADYLIITHGNFIETITPLAEWKQKKGFMTKIVTTEEIDATQEGIKEYINNAYNTWTIVPNYVLIVGDYDYVPSWSIGPGTSYVDEFLSDVPYSCVDGDDIFPDLIIGRISVNTADECEAIVDKILKYEQNPAPGDWYHNALIAAQLEDPPVANRWFMETAMNVYQYLEQEQNFNIKHALVTTSSDEYYYCQYSYPHREDILSRYEPFASTQTPPFIVPDWIVNMFTDNTTGIDQVIDAINEGVGLVQHRDHGWQEGWGIPGFDIDDFDQINNGDKLPVVFSINCLTGTFNYSEGDCFTEALLKHENGGAIGAIGATDLSYSGPNDLLVHGIYDCFYSDYDPEFSNGFNTVSMRPAEALNYGKFYLYNYDGDSPYLEIAFNEFHWFGDPELAMRTKIPETLDVTYNDTVFTYSATNYPIHVEKLGTPVEGARVCVSRTGSYDYWVGITDNSGDLTFNNFTLNEVGEYTLVVTETDAIPFEGMINSIVDGPYALLVSPLNNSATVNVPEFIDIQWMSGSGAELDLSTIDINDINVNGMTITNVQDLGDNIFRYNIIGIPAEGRVEIIIQQDQVADLIGKNNAEQRFSFIYDVTPPQAVLIYPYTEIAINKDLGYVDVSWVDPNGSGIDITTIDQTDITMDGVVFDSEPVRISGNVWRYHYQGTLTRGSHTINIGNQVVSDKVLNFNEEISFSFDYEYAEISVSPLNINEELKLGEIKNIPITISNIGRGTLNWNNHTIQYDEIFNESETKGDLLKAFQYPDDLGQLCGITSDGYYVWFLNLEGILHKLDPEFGENVLSFDINSFAPNTNALTYDGNYLWIASNDNHKLYQVNPETGEKMKEIDSPISYYIRGLSYGDNSLWVMRTFNSTEKIKVYQVNPDNGNTISTVELNDYLDNYTYDLAYTHDYLWFSSYNNTSTTIYKADRYTGEIIDSFPVPVGNYTSATYLDSDYQSNLWIGSHMRNTISLVRSGEEERPNWLTVSPPNGETVEGQPSTITLTINTRDLAEDIYHGKLFIRSDSQNQNHVVEIPINVTIDGITNERFTITTLPGVGGSIDPPGPISIGFTETATYSIIPEPGYILQDVLVNGVSVGAVSSYTFSKVNCDQTITAIFEEVPVIELSQESVQIDASPDQIITTTIDIRNIGYQSLNWKTSTQNNDTGSAGELLKSLQYADDLSQLCGITSDGYYVWFLNLTGILHKLDSESGESILSFDINSFAPNAQGLTYDGEYLWIGSNYNGYYKLYQVDPETGEKKKELDVPFFISGLSYGDNSLWGMRAFYRTEKVEVYQVDPDTGETINTVELNDYLAGNTYDLAYTHDYLWFSNYNDISTTIYKVDRYTGEIIDSFPAPIGNYTGATYLDSDYQSNLWIGCLLRNTISLVRSAGGNWLSSSPFSGDTVPQQLSEVTLTVDTLGLTAGEYSSTLIIESNSYNQYHVIEVSINLTIE